MKIERIQIINYRSIEKADISPDIFNVLVGQNNHGKTNVFEAIEWFFVGNRKNESLKDICHGKKEELKPRVTITFSGAQKGAAAMQHAANKTKIQKVLEEHDVVVIERNGDAKNRVVQVDGKEVDTGTGFDTALNDFLPKLEYVSARKFYDEVSKFSKTTPVGVMLAGVLEAVLAGDAKYKEFQKKFQELFQDDKSQVRVELNNIGTQVQLYLSKQFPDCSSVKFRVVEPAFEDLLKNFETDVHDGVETSAAEKGDGMQRALMLAIIQAYADFRRKNDDTGKSFLFLIDEAELHLHPTAQRALKNALRDIANQGDQIFLNTHSSVLVVDAEKGEKLFKVEKQKLVTSVLSVTTDTEKFDILFGLLGGSPADLLFPNNFLIVEGRSDHEFLGKVIQRFYSDKPTIQIVFASGEPLQQQRSFNAINKVYNPLWLRPIYRERAVVLCDKPRTPEQVSQLDEFKKAYPVLLQKPEKLFILPCESLEEYYPSPWKQTPVQVAAMQWGDKVKLARECGANITQEQFENEMPVLFDTLKRTWECAY
jgi:putative ATP-dependent endonuclease of the OLD family